MRILKFLRRLFQRKHHMAVVDFSALNAELDNLAINIQKVADALGAGTGSAAQIAELQASLATAQADASAKQADLDASQAEAADLAVKLKASNDALAALTPPAA
jgi:hypothetical protein